MRLIVSVPIRIYRYCLSPFIKPCCRFYPSCSQYALQAIEHYGVCKGLWRALCRVLRCNPWCSGGFDPLLPEKKENPNGY